MEKAMDKDLSKTKGRIILFFSVASFIIAFFIPAAFYYLIISRDKNLLHKQIQEIDRDFKVKETMIKEMALNSDLVDYLNDRGVTETSIYRQLYSQLHESDQEYTFHLIDENNVILLSNDNMILKGYNEIYFNFPVDFRHSNNSTGNLRYFRSKIPVQRDFIMQHQSIDYNGESIGQLVFLSDESVFDILKTGEGHYMISDQFDNVLFDNLPELEDFRASPRIMLNENERNLLKPYFSVSETVKKYNLVFEKYYTLKPIFTFVSLGLLVLSLFTILLLLVSHKFYNLLIKDNLRFSYLVREAIIHFTQGDMSYRIENEEHETIRTTHFIDKYNEILDLIEKMIEKNIEIQELATESERKLLHSQFNPHFIFNVLETIRYAIPHEATEPLSMIESLAKIMRYSISTSEELVPIEKDQVYLKEYLKLEKLRYEERLSYAIEVDEEIMDVKIPKLIFQPLVENSIKHGFFGYETLNLTIRLKKIDDYILINVQDDGKGMTKEKLEELHNQINDIRLGNDVEFYNNIGILNTVKRINNYFNEDYVFVIESHPNEGTNVYIRIKGDYDV